MNIKITEPILKKDLLAIIGLIEENIVKYDTRLEWLQSFSMGDIRIAKIDDEIIGAIIMRRNGKIFDDYCTKYFDLDHIKCPKDKYGFIAYLVVKKALQGHGIGKKLVESGIKHLKETGCEAVGVHCWQNSPGNASEKTFWSFGFKPLKMHHAPWKDVSIKRGPKEFWCVHCGNPCTCDELEMILYL